MKTSDQEAHVRIFERAIERHKATPNANPIVLQVLDMIRHEYAHIHEIIPPDEE